MRLEQVTQAEEKALSLYCLTLSPFHTHTHTHIHTHVHIHTAMHSGPASSLHFQQRATFSSFIDPLPPPSPTPFLPLLSLNAQHAAASFRLAVAPLRRGCAGCRGLRHGDAQPHRADRPCLLQGRPRHWRRGPHYQAPRRPAGRPRRGQAAEMAREREKERERGRKGGRERSFAASIASPLRI